MLNFFCFFFIALTIFARPAAALGSGWVSANYLQARLVSALTATGEERQIYGGLALRLADGWHAYWRMPGDGGLPPALNWDDSENIAAVAVSWPAPQRFETFGLYSFGYKESVLLPLVITLEEPGKPALLALAGEIMICEEICVPQKVSLALAIPAGAAELSEEAGLIDQALTQVPITGDLPTLKVENIVIGPAAIVVNAFSQNGFGQADLFIETGDIYITAPPEITPDTTDPRKAMLRVAAPEGIGNLADELADRDITVTLVSDRRAVEKTVSFSD